MTYINFQSIYTYSIAENQPESNPDSSFALEENRIIETSEDFWNKLWTEIPFFSLISPEELQEYKISFCHTLIGKNQEESFTVDPSSKKAKANEITLLWAQRKLAELKGGVQ